MKMNRDLNKQTKKEIKTRKRERILNMKARKLIKTSKLKRRSKQENENGYLT